MSMAIWRLLLVGLFTTPLLARSPDEILKRLGSDEFATRQAMSAALLTDDTLTEETLAELYAAAQTVEQRHRLMDVARHHLYRSIRKKIDQPTDKGSIGIRPDGLSAKYIPHVGRSAIVVVDTLPGFPAYGQLLPGDLLLTVDGRKLPQNAQERQLTAAFVNSIQAKHPGQLIRLAVRRGQTTKNVSLEMASLKALQSIYPQNRPIGLGLSEPVQHQWEEHRKRLLVLSKTRKMFRIERVPATTD